MGVGNSGLIRFGHTETVPGWLGVSDFCLADAHLLLRERGPS